MLSLNKGFYVGTYRHGLDAKHRLTIPAKWRFPGDEAETSYLGLPHLNGSITMYPPKMMARIEEKIEQVSFQSDDPKVRALMRRFASAERFGCDKQGRIGLPDALRQHAGIGKDALLVGTVTIFHIWDPKRYDAFMAGAAPDGADDTAILRELNL
jgi:MraZ protein